MFMERVIAKERAAEDLLYGDKERFVTSAYRKKLEERQAWLDEKKRRWGGAGRGVELGEWTAAGAARGRADPRGAGTWPRPPAR